MTKNGSQFRGSFNGHPIFSMSPPSSGGIHVIQILNILENLKLEKPHGEFEVHAMSSAMMQAFMTAPSTWVIVTLFRSPSKV